MRVLGIFEDRAFRDFAGGVLEVSASQLEVEVELEAFLTKGCSFQNLRDHFEKPSDHCGVIVGADGGRTPTRTKVRRLHAEARLSDAPSRPILWMIASPSIEAWMMADSEAVHRVLIDAYGAGRVRRSRRPPAPSSESAAKKALRSWTTAIVGRRLVRAGREHAGDIGRRVDPSRIGERRNPDLWKLLARELPEFLKALEHRA